MANSLYGLGREGYLSGAMSWSADNIKIVLVDAADYTVGIDVDQFYSDVPALARTAVSGNLATKTVTLGTADADDVVLSAVSGDPSEFIVGFHDSGVESTSELSFYIDTATGLPVTPNGGDINVAWDNGADKIFTL